ncbi:ATP-binding protein [Nocardia blacklockiae]|uniref:ATP-binding protein n=1 Tax=Nocardia blacklockiae TaxID=480036 RepID=UPI001893C8D3|nr:tetratricopeptide repeat protein [Nocardia blacklockiae]MBF6174979.1 tetratricopeptide repeat protein [Nocardia blacklockiae]
MITDVVVGRDFTIQYSVQEQPRPIVTTTLRRDVASLVGRENELARIVEAAGAGQVVSIRTIDGMPGVGKTALATRAAHRLAHKFPDGQYFVDLHGHTPGLSPAEPTDILAGLLTDLGVDPRFMPPTLRGRQNLWLDRVNGKRILLVLDNAYDDEQVEPLLPAGSGCLTLITSRRRLSALDDAIPLSLDVLDIDSAATLFISRAGRRESMSHTERAAVNDIVRLCGFLPLAIVLSASRLAQRPTWSVADLAAAFTATPDRLRELAAGPRAVRIAFTMSYRDLPSERQRVFWSLGLHPGPDTDAYATAALADITTGMAQTELEQLYTDHLIEEIQPGRFQLHDLLREYARTLAHSHGGDTVDERTDKLLDYYQAAAAAADQRLARRTRPTTALRADTTRREFGSEIAALTWLRAERANLLACLDHCATGEPARAVDLIDTLAGLLEHDGPWTFAIRLHQRGLAIARTLSDELGQANILKHLGTLHRLVGDHTDAADLYQQALTCYRRLDNRLGQAGALTNLGLVQARIGNHATAIELHEQALTLYRELGNRRGEANTLMNLGIVRQKTGDFDAANDLYTRALAAFTEVGSRTGEASALGNLGNIRQATGDYTDAIDLQQQALIRYREFGDRQGQANTLTNLGLAHTWKGDYAVAADLHKQALVRYRELGNRPGQGDALNNLGIVYEKIGDYVAAADLHEQALSRYRELGNRVGEANALNNLGITRVRTGQYSAAVDLFQKALALHDQLGSKLGYTEVLNEIGRLSLAIGEPNKALHSFAEAFAAASAINSQLEQGLALEGTARCQASLGDTAAAAVSIRQAIEIFQKIGAPEAELATRFLATLAVDLPGQ